MPRGQVPGGRPVPVLSSIPGIWACRGHLRRYCRVQRQQRVWFCCSDVGQAPPPTPAAPPPEDGRLGGRCALSALWPLGVPAREPTPSRPLGNCGRDAAAVGLPLTRPNRCPLPASPLSGSVRPGVPALCDGLSPPASALWTCCHIPGAAPRHTPYSRLHGAALPRFPHQNTSPSVHRLTPVSPSPERSLTPSSGPRRYHSGQTGPGEDGRPLGGPQAVV